MKVQDKTYQLENVMSNESTVMPSFRCSINEDLDEGDISKHLIYSQLTRVESVKQRQLSGNQIGLLQEAQQQYHSVVLSKQVSQQYSSNQELLTDQEGINMRPNPSPFKNRTLEIPKFIPEIQAFNYQQSQSSRNHSSRDFPLEHSQTMPQYQDNYNLVKLQMMKTVTDFKNNYPLETAVASNFSMGSFEKSTQGINKQAQKKHLKTGSQQQSNRADQDNSATKKRDTTYYYESNPLQQNAQQKLLQSANKNNQLFKIPNKKQSPLKSTLKYTKLSQAQSNSDLRLNQHLSTNTSMQQLTKAPTAGKLNMKNGHKAMFLSPPMKPKRQNSNNTQKKVLNTQKNKNDTGRLKVCFKEESKSRFSDLVDFKQQETPPQQYQVMVTSESERCLDSHLRKTTPFEFSSKSRSAEIVENEVANSALAFVRQSINTPIDKEIITDQNEYLLDESISLPLIDLANLNNHDSKFEENSQHLHEVELVTEQVTFTRNENSSNKQGSPFKREVRLTRTDTYNKSLFSQKQANSNQQRTVKSKKSSKAIGYESTKRLGGNPQTHAFSIETFKQMFDQGSRKHNLTAKKQTLEHDNPLKTPRVKKESQYQPQYNLQTQKKLQDQLEKAQQKASKRKIEIIELKNENLNLRTLVNYLLQVKLNEQ